MSDDPLIRIVVLVPESVLRWLELLARDERAQGFLATGASDKAADVLVHAHARAVRREER